MSVKHPNDKILFGLKVKQLRVKQGLSFAELSQKTGISVSYLNEIEKGKKYPKRDKIRGLADVLNADIEYLTSNDYDEGIAPVAELLQSNFFIDLILLKISNIIRRELKNTKAILNLISRPLSKKKREMLNLRQPASKK